MDLGRLGFVFSLQLFNGEIEKSMGYDVYPWFADVKDMNMTPASLSKLVSDINNIAMLAARSKAGKRWLNE